MSAGFSGSGPGSAGAQTVEPEPAAPAQQTRPPFWRRPVGIVLIFLAAVGFGVGLIVGLMGFIGFRSSAPAEQAQQAQQAPADQNQQAPADQNQQANFRDFATEADQPMTVWDGISWDQSNGTLNLYPTEVSLEGLDFPLPAPSDAVTLEATLIQPAYDQPGGLLWGIEVFNSTNGNGVMLLCAPGETMYLADSLSREPLPMGGSKYACEETMEMTLIVNGELGMVVFGADNSDGNTAYHGGNMYADLDAVAVLIYAEEPNQVLRVAKIAAEQS